MLHFLSVLLFCSLSQAIEKIEVSSSKPLTSDHFFIWQPAVTEQNGLQELWAESVNVNYAGGANRPRFFQIRGAGERSQFENFNQSPVGFFYEGIDLSEEANVFSPSQNQSTQVAYGDQATDYGSKGFAGVVLSQICHPEDCVQSEVSLSLSSQERVFPKLFLPIKNKSHLSSVLSGGFLSSKGFQTNRFLNKKTGFRKEGNLELHNFYDDGSWQLSSHHLYANHQNGYDHWSFDGSLKTLSDKPGSENQETHGHSFILDKFFSNFSINSSLSFTGTHSLQSYDEDWGNNQAWNQLAGWNQDYDYSTKNYMERKKWHYKLKAEVGSWDFGAHLSHFYEELHINGYKGDELRKSISGRFKNNSQALFIKNITEFGSRVLLRTAARLENQRIKGKSFGVSQEQEDVLWAMSTRLQYLLSKVSQGYFLVSKSYRGGGFNLQEGLSQERNSFSPEAMLLFEKAFHFRFKNSSFLLKLFYMLREDMQLRTAFQEIPNDPSRFRFYTDNASSSRSYGTELFYDFNKGNWRVQTSFGILISEFQNYKYASVDLSGRELPHAPSYSFRNQVDYSVTQQMRLTAVFYGKEAFYFSNSHQQRSKPYQLLDIGINYSLDSWDLSLWVKNLANKNYATRGFYFGNEPPSFQDKLYIQRGEPLHFGFKVSYQF